MLVALKRELKEFVSDNEQQALCRRLLDEILNDQSELYNLTVSLLSRIGQMTTEDMEGVQSFEHGSLRFNNINKALLYVVDQVAPNDLNAQLSSKGEEFLHVPTNHSTGVDRSPQAEQFEMDLFLSEDPDKKVFFYYLHGDIRQEAPALIERLGLELSGRRLEASALSETFSGREPVMIDTKPEPRGNAQLFTILLLKSLVEKFVGPVNNMRDLKSKTLTDLLPSPKLGGMTADDSVCITVRLDHHNWNKAVVPPVLRELYEKFCNCELPADSPKFYFFFGLEYPKEKVNIRQEVADAIAARAYGEAFEELTPVTASHIEEWFTRHEPMIPDELEASELVALHFSEQAEYDMKDVIATLRRLIDQHNKGVSLRQKL